MTRRGPKRLRPGRRLVYSLLPAAMLVILAGGILEIGLRLRHESTEQITGAAEWRLAEFGGFSYHWDKYHRLLGWTNQPGYQSDTTIPFTVTINSQGLRATKDYPPRSASGISRIALFGDSLVFGEEVDDGHTVADHLSEIRPDWEVLNYGVHGYGLGQSVLRLEHEGNLLEPDRYVIMVLFPEDLVRDRISHFVHPKPVFRIVDGSLSVENVPVPEASRTPLLMRASYAAGWLFGRRGAWHRIAPDRSLDLALGRAVAQHAASVCADRGKPLTVVVLLAPAGALRYVSEPEWRRRFDAERKEFLDLEMDMLDLVPAQVEAYTREKTDLFAPLAHWSSRGNRIWAERIASHLERKLGPRAQPEGRPRE